MLAFAVRKDEFSESGWSFMRAFEAMMVNIETMSTQDRTRAATIFKEIAPNASCEVAQKFDLMVAEYVQHRIDDPNNHGIPIQLDGKSTAEIKNDELTKLNIQLQRERDQAIEAVSPDGEKGAWEIYTQNLRQQNANLYIALERVEELLAAEKDKNSVLVWDKSLLVNQLMKLGVEPEFPKSPPHASA